MTRAHFSLLILSLFFLSLGKAIGSGNKIIPNDSIELAIPLGGMPSLQAIDTLFPKPFLLGSLTYESDTPFEREEFLYLVDLKQGELVTPQAVKQSITYLSKKNKFSAIRLTVTPDKKNIHMVFDSFWTLKRVTISGILNGRDVYRYLYDLDPGEAFDEKKHKHSLEAIKEELGHQGYLLAVVNDTFSFDYATKSLFVNIEIQRGPRFHFGSVVVECVSVGEHKIPSSECAVLHEKIDRLFAKRLEGKAYSSAFLNKYGKHIKRFLAKKGFLQAGVTLAERVDEKKHTVEIVITINLHEKKEFVFFGNHFFSDQQLQDTVLSFGQSTLLVPSTLLAQEIETRYQKKGFLNIKVEAREEDSVCFFVITEGSRAAIKKIELHGAQQLSPDLFKTYYYGLTKKHSFFDEDTLKRVIDDIEAVYHREGFSVARVSYETTPISHTPAHYVAHINIDEGKRYYLNKVSVSAFPELERQGPFLDFLNAPKPMPFDSQQLYMQRRWLVDYFHTKGYLYLDIKPIVTVQSAPCCLVDVEWQIILQKDQVTFGKTVIVGSCPLPFKRFMRELHYQEGQVWNKTALEQSLLRFRDLNLFSTIHLYPESISFPEPYKVIMAKLVEDEPFEIRVRAGVLGVARNLTWREGATYKVGGSLLCKNIFDTGGQLRFDADLTKFERYMSGYYVYPWLFGMPYKTMIKAYSNRYIQPVVLGSKDQLYVAIQQGFLVGLNRKYNNVTTNLNVGLEWMETLLKNKEAAQAINFSPALVDVKIPYLYLEPTIVVDYLDDKLNPTLGSFTVASAKSMVPLGKVKDSLIKVLVEQSFFYPIYRTLIGGFRFRIGHIFNQCFNQIMPPERFYLGGENSVRGYEPDLAPPLGCFVDSSCRKKFVPQGGKSMLNANIELRFPLFRSISGAVFQDAGVLIGDDVSCIAGQVVAATGAGFRYNTPVGPLRFDVGFKWKKRYPSDSRMAWFLTLGNAF